LVGAMPLSSIRNSFRRKSKPSKFAADGSTPGNPKDAEENNKNGGADKLRSGEDSGIFTKIADRKALWSSRVEAHNTKQASNPFSGKYKGPQKLDKNDPNYGRPDQNSLTAQRARDGEAKLRQEVCDLCNVIFEMGEKPSGSEEGGGEEDNQGKARIKFGKLFQIYNGINDKVVGLLIRARKKRMLTFEGEMLFQRRDDEKWISLTKNINTIFYYYGRDPEVAGGGAVDHSDPDIKAATEERNNNKEEESIRPAVPSDPLPHPQASDGGPEDSSEGETKTSSAVLTLAPPPPPQRRKKSSVIQQIRKFSTRKRSELKPVAAPASEDIPENQNQVVAERKKSGGASGISTLFVNLTRKPSRVARNFRKKSKAPPPPTSQPPSNPGPSTSAAEEEGETKTVKATVEATEATQPESRRTAVQRWALARNVSRVIGGLATVRGKSSTNENECKKSDEANQQSEESVKKED